MNADKILDLPVAVAFPHGFNQLLVWGAKTKEGNPAFYYTNFKVAEGLADTRTKLLSGKYSTNGILFDTNSDRIRPESTGLIREIASALKENGSIKFTIIGHTDNKGNSADNLALSKRRAEAVKKTLVESYGIEGSLLQTDGKGAAQPVTDNGTITGRAQNRRVEFIKV
jgi:outer membrane protein OmpA-like peptidoglycan-associated protein